MVRRRTTAMVVGALVAGGILAGGAVSASAVTERPSEGGVWDHGTRSGGIYGSGGQVYSEYQHSGKSHKATACGHRGCAYSGWQPSSTLAVAHWSPLRASGNTAYYDVRE
ncbi:MULTISPECIES: lactococcin 972 family bacteriocin [unclassified Rathayibacter]|uniref:lactococcin 972 family bacteriocin n=1 Tax=unclassified Rathayibacter TaxID=2609250 RepID=UPI001FB3C094|nr:MULTISPECIES: lactococcin 972 family bacteriocin [unclassified Rathayibacter]MCJ1672650.1 lactococcin 972 family bacteriocin [Rathayibacter sp. VKM Ac-2929]